MNERKEFYAITTDGEVHPVKVSGIGPHSLPVVEVKTAAQMAKAAKDEGQAAGAADILHRLAQQVDRLAEAVSEDVISSSLTHFQLGRTDALAAVSALISAHQHGLQVTCPDLDHEQCDVPEENGYPLDIPGDSF